MNSRIPVIPTILVIAAVITMIGLGFWQLGRMDEKEAMLAAYSEATQEVDAVSFPVSGDGKDLWFRQSTIECIDVLDIETVAGTSDKGQKGWAQRATCKIDEDAAVLVDLGYSRSLQTPRWTGGAVTGVIAPGPRLVANPPQAGLQSLAKPDPGNLPNNHLAYAGQWFFFALTAVLIYGFAVRSRLRKKD
ncbi:SURF1 family cytochrome oxidase biogenesis protein [Erythrobacter crassostreae]|uniref:SURF1-like protein n=1 Tax=Erythrobacter crassostreae TaxID=2828328 RepID=A0A9X1F3S9_9SPHN|nr:SURF1 family protein [Erythrobacter crassostrea]MBV7259547.1 SURF1 family protein [Erythrobacter crassostrea]